MSYLFFAIEEGSRRMKDMLVGMPAIASNVALEVVHLLKSSKALESETTANRDVNMDGVKDRNGSS
jgi:hypothetical protein